MTELKEYNNEKFGTEVKSAFKCQGDFFDVSVDGTKAFREWDGELFIANLTEKLDFNNMLEVKSVFAKLDWKPFKKAIIEPKGIKWIDYNEEI